MRVLCNVKQYIVCYQDNITQLPHAYTNNTLLKDKCSFYFGTNFPQRTCPRPHLKRIFFFINHNVISKKVFLLLKPPVTKHLESMHFRLSIFVRHGINKTPIDKPLQRMILPEACIVCSRVFFVLQFYSTKKISQCFQYNIHLHFIYYLITLKI